MSYDVVKGNIKRDLANEKCWIEFSLSQEKVIDLVNRALYNALNSIRDIIQDDSLSDFEAIEKIVNLFEKLGIDFGSRHDFG